MTRYTTITISYYIPPGSIIAVNGDLMKVVEMSDNLALVRNLTKFERFKYNVGRCGRYLARKVMLR